MARISGEAAITRGRAVLAYSILFGFDPGGCRGARQCRGTTAAESGQQDLHLACVASQPGHTWPITFMLMDQYLERVVDLLDPSLNCIYNMTVAEARRRVLSGKPEAVREIDGSFALLAREGKTVRLARSLDRPMRYFLAKRHEGPALVVARPRPDLHALLHAATQRVADRPGRNRAPLHRRARG